MGFCSVKINFSVNPHFLLIKPQKVVGKNVKFDKKSWEKVFSIIVSIRFWIFNYD
jgi:hypothetical protein